MDTLLQGRWINSCGVLRVKLFGCFAGDRQFDKEPASFAFGALYFDLTTVSHDDRFDN
jgi:hypothetical protein